VVSYDYNPAFRVVDGVVMRGDFMEAGSGWESYDFDLKALLEFNSYFHNYASNYYYSQNECENSGFILNGSSCVEPTFYDDVDNPKTTIYLESGYNYISLRSDKTLCDQSILSYSFCDQNNTLNSVFGSNSHIEKVYKHRGSWSYWDANSGVDSNSILNKFISIGSGEALLVKTDSATQIELPYSYVDSSNEINYGDLVKDKWYLLTTYSDIDASEINALVDSQSDNTLKYIMRLKNGVWSVYAPTNDADVDATVVRLNSLQMYDSYWILLQ
jgi:hypothetical protein